MAHGDVKVRITGDGSELRRELRHIDLDLRRIEPRLKRLRLTAFWKGWATAAVALSAAHLLIDWLA